MRTAAVLDSRIAETRAAMEKLGSAVQEPEERAENLSSLNELIQGCRDFLSSIHLFQQTHARANREAAEVEKINAQLGDVAGDLFEQVHVDLLPSDSTIEELATNWCNSQQEYESLDRQHKQAIRTLEEIRSTKEKLADERPIASLENLHGMRVRRKELWDQLQTLQYQS
jgi:prefoldin subunit 5